MGTIQTNYTITVDDFRHASYYAAALQHRRSLQVLALFLAGGLVYLYGIMAELWQVNYLAAFIIVAYLIWGLIFFAGVELRIRKYVMSPDTLIGCSFTVTLQANQLFLQVPERNIRHSCSINRLTAVFELSKLFLIYISSQELYILPKRALCDEEVDALRSNFTQRIPDRFSAPARRRLRRI